MFQPSEYHDKRSAMNEILLQQLVGLVQGLIPAVHAAAGGSRAPQELTHALGQAHQSSQQMLQNYGIGMQAIKNKEADRILGPVERIEGVSYADSAMVLEYLKANVGRTYFGTEEKTSAPDGSVGTAGFGKKFKDWLADLPDYDLVVSKDIAPGFYKDTNSQPGMSIPLLALRRNNEVIIIVFRKYISVDVLNLDYVPADFRWDSHSKFALRGELYSYRGDLTVSELESLFLSALSTQGITTVNKPELPVVTNGLSQVVESDEEPARAETDVNGVEGDVYSENETPASDDFEARLQVLREVADAGTKQELYDVLNRLASEAFRENPTEETYNKMLRVSAAFHGPGDAFAWNDMSDEDKTSLLARVIKRLAEAQ